MLEEEAQQEVNDFITPDTQNEEVSVDQTEQLFNGLLAERLVEYYELNAIGRRALKSEVFRTIQEDRIPPEFQSNLVVFQPKFVSRVGTNFGSAEGTQRNIVTTRSGVRAALVRRETGRNARTDVYQEQQNANIFSDMQGDTGTDSMSQGSTPRRRSTSTATTTSTSTGGSYSGGGGGGGY